MRELQGLQAAAEMSRLRAEVRRYTDFHSRHDRTAYLK